MGKHVREQPASACGCIHIDGIWVTPDEAPCIEHKCTLCLMRAGRHGSHIQLEPRPIHTLEEPQND